MAALVAVASSSLGLGPKELHGTQSYGSHAKAWSEQSKDRVRDCVSTHVCRQCVWARFGQQRSASVVACLCLPARTLLPRFAQSAPMSVMQATVPASPCSHLQTPILIGARDQLDEDGCPMNPHLISDCIVDDIERACEHSTTLESRVFKFVLHIHTL